MLIEELHASCFEILRSYARSICRDDSEADDLVQHAFLTALERWDMLSVWTNEHIKAYLLRSIMNRMIDNRRREKRIAPAEEMPELPIETDFSRTFVREAMAQLPDRLRQIASLRFIEGLNSSQIGERLQLPPPTVRTRLRAAAMILKAYEKGEL